MADAAAPATHVAGVPNDDFGRRALLVAGIFVGLVGLSWGSGRAAEAYGVPLPYRPVVRALVVLAASLVLALAGRGVPLLRVRSSQALVAGLIFVALAEFSIWAMGRLPIGSLRSMGPAALPTWLAVGVELCGFALIAAAFGRESERVRLSDLSALSVLLVLVLPFPIAAAVVVALVASALLGARWLSGTGLRAPVLVFVGIWLFALTIRPFTANLPGLPPFQFGGLIFAGPLALIIGGHATPEARLRELVVLALGLTAFCMLLFGDMLNLPIPLYPQWLADAMRSINPGLSSKAVLRIVALFFIGAGVLAYAVGRSLDRSAPRLDHAGA